MCHINFIRVSDMDSETKLSNLTVHQTNIKKMHNFVTEMCAPVYNRGRDYVVYIVPKGSYK